jgi:hypothetical protein
MQTVPEYKKEVLMKFGSVVAAGGRPEDYSSCTLRPAIE